MLHMNLEMAKMIPNVVMAELCLVKMLAKIVSGNGQLKLTDGRVISDKYVGKTGSGNGKNETECGKNGSNSAKAVIPKTELPGNKKASISKNEGQK